MARVYYKNKPNWSDAPEWAKFLILDSNHEWQFLSEKPTDYLEMETKHIAEKETVNHPDHYNQIAGIECIDVARHFSFNLGNVIKYIWRAYHKGATIEDLEKAVWYLQDEIKMLREKH